MAPPPMAEDDAHPRPQLLAQLREPVATQFRPECAPAPVHFVIDGLGRSWHQSPVVMLPPASQQQQERGRKSSDRLPIVDFDVLCATVARQSEALAVELDQTLAEETAGGVQRMWEGGVLACFDESEIVLQTVCCPCVTFGKSLARAGFGTCFGKGSIYFLLLAGAITSYSLYLCTLHRLFFFVAVGLLISLASFAGYFRIQIRRRFNIKGSSADSFVSAVDDYLNHCLCGFCTLCQEARTLEMNNVHDGNWHGRGDTVLVGSYSACGFHHSQPAEMNHPVVITVSPDSSSKDSLEHSWIQSADGSSSPFISAGR
eukprot:c25816_g1_i3 orf=214-1158(+)